MSMFPGTSSTLPDRKQFNLPPSSLSSSLPPLSSLRMRRGEPLRVVTVLGDDEGHGPQAFDGRAVAAAHKFEERPMREGESEGGREGGKVIERGCSETLQALRRGRDRRRA